MSTVIKQTRLGLPSTFRDERTSSLKVSVCGDSHTSWDLKVRCPSSWPWSGAERTSVVTAAELFVSQSMCDWATLLGSEVIVPGLGLGPDWRSAFLDLRILDDLFMMFIIRRTQGRGGGSGGWVGGLRCCSGERSCQCATWGRGGRVVPGSEAPEQRGAAQRTPPVSANAPVPAALLRPLRVSCCRLRTFPTQFARVFLAME